MSVLIAVAIAAFFVGIGILYVDYQFIEPIEEYTKSNYGWPLATLMFIICVGAVGVKWGLKVDF